MDVLLKPELERYVNEKVAAGVYPTRADALNAAVATLKSAEANQREWAHQTRHAIEIGWEQSERGEIVSGEQVLAELDAMRREPDRTAP